MNLLAQIKNPTLNTTLQGKTGVEFVGSLITTVISLFFVVGAIVFVFMLLYGGLQWISSGGDKGAVEQAKGRISNALIGIIVLFAVIALVVVVERVTGTNLLLIDIGPLIIK